MKNKIYEDEQDNQTYIRDGADGGSYWRTGSEQVGTYDTKSAKGLGRKGVRDLAVS